MSHQVNELARRHFNHKGLKAMAESHKNFEEEDKLRREMQVKGVTPLFGGDREAHKTVSINPETGKEDYNVYHSDLQAKLDWKGAKEKIWDTVKPNLGQLSNEQASKVLKAIDGYIATGTWTGINDARIEGLLKHAIKTYQSTPEYTQELKAETKNLGNQDEAQQLIRERLTSEGTLHTFSQTHPQYLEDWLLRKSMEGKDKVAPLVPGLETGIKFKDLNTGKNMDIDLLDPTFERKKEVTDKDVNDYIINKK